MAVRELVQAIPPILTAQLSIATPAKTLATCRIHGNNDPTIGTIGWLVPTDDSAWMVIKVKDVKNTTPETNRVWGTYTLELFLGIAHADTPDVSENFNDQATQWLDAMQNTVASNRRLLPASLTVSPTVGDVRWEYTGGGVRERHPVFGTPYYGVLFNTSLCIVYGVNYEG